MTDKIRTSRAKRVPVATAKNDRFDDQLENDSRFLRRIEQARKSLRAGRGVRLENVKPGR